MAQERKQEKKRITHDRFTPLDILQQFTLVIGFAAVITGFWYVVGLLIKILVTARHGGG